MSGHSKTLRPLAVKHSTLPESTQVQSFFINFYFILLTFLLCTLYFHFNLGSEVQVKLIAPNRSLRILAQCIRSERIASHSRAQHHGQGVQVLMVCYCLLLSSCFPLVSIWLLFTYTLFYSLQNEMWHEVS